MPLAAVALLALTLRDVPRAYVSAGSDRIQITDFDLDGNPDVVTDGFPQGSILYGRGDLSLEPPVFFGTQAGSGSSTSAVIADFDGDGWPDLISIDFKNGNGSEVVLRHNLGGRRFEERPLPGHPALPLHAADFTGDGAPDVLFAAYPDAQLAINDGRGSFPTMRAIKGMTMVTRDPAIGDFDGDGDLDFAIQSGTTVDL